MEWLLILAVIFWPVSLLAAFYLGAYVCQRAAAGASLAVRPGNRIRCEVGDDIGTEPETTPKPKRKIGG